MSNINDAVSVEEAKKVLRQARLADHTRAMSKALGEGNFDNLASASSRFLALYRAKPKNPKGKGKKA